MNRQTIEESIKSVLEELYLNNANQEDIIASLKKIAREEQRDFEEVSGINE